MLGKSNFPPRPTKQESETMYNLSHIRRRVETLKRRFAPSSPSFAFAGCPRNSVTTGTEPSREKSPPHVTFWMRRSRPSSPASGRPAFAWTPGWPCASTSSVASTTRSVRNPATLWVACSLGPPNEASCTPHFGTAPKERRNLCREIPSSSVGGMGCGGSRIRCRRRHPDSGHSAASFDSLPVCV